tara:strand:- start:2658 stop:3197 length:540 start_codon:yes stop_codon:yes gene_type:complete
MRNLLLKNFYKLKRNPSNVQVLLLAIIIILIIYILFGNQIISTAKNNLETTLKNRNEREFSGDIDVEAWQYSWIRTGIINMKNAQGPAQWRAINWEKGCFSRRITKWNEIYQNTIQDSCEKLNIIQKDYDNYCLGINENCEIPVEALKELSEVMSNLENAFSNAGFVLPYNELEETGIE